MIDPQGRVVVMHGENVVVKGSPWVATERGFDDADAAFLANNGLNSVRLGFVWAGIEPEPGVFDGSVLAQIKAEIQMLHARGIGVLLDAHQDMFNPKYQGDGFPDWAINDSGLPNPALGFPNNYLANPAEQESWNNFWNDQPAPGDTVGVQTRYIQMWQHVAAYLADQPGIVGYDLINEPMPGTGAASCLAADGCGNFEATQLSAFYRGLTVAIGAVDPRRLIFFEPQPGFAFGDNPTSVNDGHAANAVFNFHNYCLTSVALAGADHSDADCGIVDEQVFQHADAEGRRTGDPEFMSEFGAATSPTDLGDYLGDADQHMVGWTEWEFCGCNEADDSTAPSSGTLVADESKPPTGANLNQTLLEQLVRPYPEAIAGTPTSWSYDTSTHSFTFAYSTRPAGHRLAARARTEVFLPRLVYTSGYTARVTGGCILSQPDAQLLEIANRHGAKTVTLNVTPGGDAGATPKETRCVTA
jgi:endoglycosylceramidase